MLFPKGEAAALGAAMCWSVSALAFEAASKRIGSVAVNILRLVLALVFLSLYCGAARGRSLPTDAAPANWAWLGVSGLIGFTLGDLCLFRAYILIGARLTMLIMSLVPPLTGVIGAVVLGERLGGVDWLGMAITVGGVCWVVLERSPREGTPPLRPSLTGIALALAATAGQAVGLILSKIGMAGSLTAAAAGVTGYDPFAATQIRIIAGAVGFGAIIVAAGWWARVRASLGDRRALAEVGLGAVFGPCIGVSLSLMSVQHARTGVAATLMSIVPVLIIAPSVLVLKERVSARSVAGAVIAVGGVAVMMLL
jgi:drug/metabolite transporter (DMT)-like permease